MLNPFPNLLVLGFFAPTLLRVAAALVIFYIVYVITAKRHELMHMSLPLIGKPPLWVLRAGSAIYALIGLSLFVGYDTQWAAILGALIALKCFIWKRRYPAAVPLSHIASALLFVICLSLLISGAGALALDIHL